MSGRLSRMMTWTLTRSARLIGSGSPTRQHVARQELLKRRANRVEDFFAARRASHRSLVERVKAEHDEHLAGNRGPPVIDALIISGGGDWGAFGAGFLKGWRKIPREHPFAMPEFDAVTGVSTGTLIAPFAFLGDDRSIDQIVALYRNPRPDWVRQRGILYFLPDNISFAEVPGLEREVRNHLTADMLRRIVDAGADGRILTVNTTNVDEGRSHVFDLVEEARQAVRSGQRDRIHDIVLASAGIPGAFPFRMIDGGLYVDGA